MAITKISQSELFNLDSTTEGIQLPVGPTGGSIIDYLVVAGGGGGGGSNQGYTAGGGGGAGGLRTSFGSTSGGGASSESSFTITTGTAYTVTVGTGGAAGGGALYSGPNGTNGSNSVFDSITAIGGGGGGSAYNGSAALTAGGSGGGSTDYNNTAGTATANQGFAGGTAYGNYDGDGSGGGGGAGAVGDNGGDEFGGDGGNGLTISITGTSVAYAGGGGGGQWMNNRSSGNPGAGGSGGGGAGGALSAWTGNNGTTNTGGGGGGGSASSTGSSGNPNGGVGGSGVVILRYPNTFTATYSAGASGAADAEVTDGTEKYIKITAGTGTVTFSGTPPENGRPSLPTQGEMRYNTSFKQVEYFNGTNWFTINYVPEIVKTNLVLSWDTTETSGSGSTGNLLNLNGTSVTSTDNGLTKNNASSLDPSGNQGWDMAGSLFISTAVNMDDVTFFNASNSTWSLEVWCKINSKAASGAVFANSWLDGSTWPNENFILGLYGAGSTSTAGGFHSLVRVSSTLTNYINIGPSTGPNYGNWSQFVFVASTSDVKLYVNGAFVASVPYNSNGTGTPQTQNRPMVIGRRDTGGSNGWNGVFRICRMYKTALSASDILQNYNVDKSTFGLS